MNSLINSIYISIATLEILIILYLRATNSIAYDYFIWILPIILLIRPIFNLFSYMFNMNKNQNKK